MQGGPEVDNEGQTRTSTFSKNSEREEVLRSLQQLSAFVGEEKAAILHIPVDEEDP